MTALIEWFTEIHLVRRDGSAVTHEDANQILESVIAWAERRQFGVGGGFDLEPHLSSQAVFRLGICATRPAQLIDETEMATLLPYLEEIARPALEIASDYRPFFDREADPDRLEVTLRTRVPKKK